MSKEKLIKTAYILAVVTIAYNVTEGVISVIFGIKDDTLALLGFGVDSFVEVLSGIGILHMIYRMRKAGLNDVSSRDRFERYALRVTGTAFYILVAGLVAGSVLKLIFGSEPLSVRNLDLLKFLNLSWLY